MHLAAIQLFATPFAVERNLATAERLIRAAVAQGARLVVLPELFNTGYVYSPRLFEAAEGDGGPSLARLIRLSAELNAHLAGTLLLREGARIFNVFVLVTPEGQVHKYRKRHPFAWEQCYFEAGRAPLIVETGFGRVGLMTCWDVAHRDVSEAYRGRVDVVLMASAPPRFHRAVLNFPLGKKVYLAELTPALLRDREVIDGWYGEQVAARARWVGAPIVHACMAGRFVSTLPWARVSLLSALAHPRYWSLIPQAPLASLRATFYASTAIYSAQGETLAAVMDEEGVAVTDVRVGAAPPAGEVTPAPYLLPAIPSQLALLERLMAWLGGREYRRHVSR